MVRGPGRKPAGGEEGVVWVGASTDVHQLNVGISLQNFGQFLVAVSLRIAYEFQ